MKEIEKDAILNSFWAVPITIFYIIPAYFMPLRLYVIWFGIILYIYILKSNLYYDYIKKDYKGE